MVDVDRSWLKYGAKSIWFEDLKYFAMCDSQCQIQLYKAHLDPGKIFSQSTMKSTDTFSFEEFLKKGLTHQDPIDFRK